MSHSSQEAPTDRTQPLEASGPHARCRRFQLEVLEGPGKGATFGSRGVRTVVGTKPACDFVLHDPTVSRFHCEIRVEQGRAVIRDLRSLNGTAVDGVLIREAYIASEAMLTLGQSRLRLSLTDEHVKVALSPRQRFGGLVGDSTAMRAVFAVLERACRTDASVILEGETGTGKERAVEALHQEGARRTGPLVVVDVGALPPSLIDSELFGHRKGAFTGAVADRQGAFAAAHGGTLYLDEVGELPLELQPKLLRALDRREVVPLGAAQPVSADVRVVASSRQNLEEEVNAGRFRSDLFFRLAVLTVRLPPLRDRREDLPLLVEDLLGELAAPPQLAHALRAPERLAELSRHAWWGNVRELRNHLERCIALEALQAPWAPGHRGPPAIDPHLPMRQCRERWLDYFEQRYLQALLAEHGGNVAAAARAAGVNRVHLHRLLARAGLR
jgi:two-component system, NtrC family, response regulator GlrR